MYQIEDYERPSVAADAVVFGIDTEPTASSKGLQQRKLKLLLVRRGEEPFLHMFSLPGGFLRKNETIQQAAWRELREEAGVNSPHILPLDVYSAPGRDPRGWIVSCAFLALTRTVVLATDALSDAVDAQWFEFDFQTLSSHEEQLTLSASSISITLRYQDGKLSEGGLAFDHGQIIYDAFQKLRDEVMHHDLIFELMPSLFAVSDLQQPYEIITGTHTSPQNFRKKMLTKIEETELFNEAAAHRTAKLYRKKQQ
ncbi:MAG: NUDIX hydrolase [Oscillospiraceae bacterium]|nr:NUDIX hydrolase [Oscillospiraceae bacterium]